MFVTVKFNQDTPIVVQDYADSMPYPVLYQKGETEHVDILEQQGQTIHVQFEDGTVGWIKSRFLEITHDDQSV